MHSNSSVTLTCDLFLDNVLKSTSDQDFLAVDVVKNVDFTCNINMLCNFMPKVKLKYLDNFIQQFHMNINFLIVPFICQPLREETPRLLEWILPSYSMQTF